MYSDLRKAQSKLTEDKICDCFLELLMEKDISKITIKEICEKTGISRGTFYLHYVDINQLIDTINSWYISRAVPYYQLAFDSFGIDNDYDKFVAGVRGHLEILASWPKYAITILGKNVCPNVYNSFMEICWKKLEENLKRSGTVKNLRDYQYDFAYRAGGVQEIMRKWCKDGLTESVDTILDYIIKSMRQ